MRNNITNTKYLKPNTKQKILLGHGSGGRLMHDLIKKLFLPRINNPILDKLSDSAVIELKDRRLAFTTDSFVVSPLFFKGGDIGKLAICGTVNDLVMLASIPRFISLAMIIEEGLDYNILEKIVDSISFNARGENIDIVTGDIKVVEKGSCDKIFINTSGIGIIVKGRKLSIKSIEAEDEIMVTGRIAEHGLSILSGRKGINLDFNIKSDCNSLSNLLLPILRKSAYIKFMRDPTRGGLATTLNEIAESSGLGIIIEEKKIPISGKVKAACELLGLDPLYIANEGKAVLVVNKKYSHSVLAELRKHPLGKFASVIGKVTRQPKKKVYLKTAVGGERIIDMLTSENLLPRIC